MSKQNPFAIAEGKRIDITNEQAKQIRDMYKGIEKEFGERIRILSNKSNISSIMREQYLKDFTKDLQDRITLLNQQLEGTITNNALEVAKAVTEDNDKMLREMGFGGVFTSDFHIPQDAVNSIITGKLYEGKWTLSKAIWSDNQKKLNDINSIVAKGLAENKSTYELAKDLERYVNPQARKEWNWSKVYPGTSKKIDYNAQRLARTMISHAYQESFVLNTKDNPFIEAYQWLASGGDRMCDICAERDGKIYQKDELPLDHPNGMCTFMIVKEKSYEEIAKDLSNWVNGTGDSELNEKLDNYADTLGYNIKAWTATTQPVQEANNLSEIKRNLDFNDIDFKKYVQAKEEIGFEGNNWDFFVQYREGKIQSTMLDNELLKSMQKVEVNPISISDGITGKDITGTWERRPNQFKFEIDDILNAQGFDGLPQVVSPAEFDKYAAENNLIMQRTYSAQNKEVLDVYRNELYNGKWYVDCSTGGAMHGEGMYAYSENSSKVPDSMKQSIKDIQSLNEERRGNKYHNVETMTLTKDANVISENNLLTLFENEVEKYANTHNMDYFDAQDIFAEIFPNNHDESDTAVDLGMYAAAKGYDAINTDGGISVVLNRTKLIIRGEE